MKTEDLIGHRFGRLVVIGKAKDDFSKNGKRIAKWHCRCDCGNELDVREFNLKNGNTKSCGCYRISRIKEKLTEDLVGQRFGRLIVVERADNLYGRTAWKCKCDCGGSKIAISANLKRGLVTSCGCKVKENRVPDYAIKYHKHNMSRKRIYGVWLSMKDRCYNVNCSTYENYGGRGIKVCDEWLGENGAENFIKWAYENGYDKNAPYGECTLDRRDVNGDYEPDNCRWVTQKEQANNKRNNLKFEYKGEIKTLAEWCEIYEKNYDSIRRRIVRDGWEFEKALLTPLDTKKLPKKVIQISRETKEVIAIYKNIAEASEKTGINRRSISRCCNNKQEEVFGFAWEFTE